MMESKEQIKFITDYIAIYSSKISMSNDNGLFDEAKLFESFAMNVCSLYFGMEFKNLNDEKKNYPYVDLVSIDNNIYIQVSTASNIPSKINDTLNKINNSQNEIRNLYFFVMDNESIKNVKDIQIGNISFKKEQNLITLSKIIRRAKNDIDFQTKLYILLKGEDKYFKIDLKNLQNAINDSKNIFLKDINDTIGSTYHINLDEEIDSLNIKNKKFMFIIGEPGSGKSVFCKKIVENKSNLLFIRAEKLVKLNSINEIWGFDISRIFESLKDDLYIFIDALEFISDNKNNLDLLKILFARIGDNQNIHLIASCRTSEISVFSSLIGEYNIKIYETKPLSNVQLLSVANSIPILKNIIKDASYSDLIRNPFYLNVLSNTKNPDSFSNINKIRNYLWNSIICLNDVNIEEVVTEIVLDRAMNFQLGSSLKKYNQEIIRRLQQGNVVLIDEKNKTVRMKFDIFEDICFEEYIDEKFKNAKGDYNNFFNTIDILGRCIYRRYQIWIENKLFTRNDREKFLYCLVFGDLPEFWRMQTKIGIIKSKYCETFFSEYADKIKNDNLFFNFVNLINLYGFTFTIGPDSFPSNLLITSSGKGRGCIIKMLADDEILCEKYLGDESILKLLYDYSQLTGKFLNYGNHACKILLNFLKKYELKTESGDIFYPYKNVQNIIQILYRLNDYCCDWIASFFNLLVNDYSSEEIEVKCFANDAIEDILSSNGIPLTKKFNKNIYKIINLYFLTNKNDNFQGLYNDFHLSRVNYGLNDRANNYGLSRYRTNMDIFWALFYFNYFESLKWLIDFVNACTNKYSLINPLENYEIYFADTNKIKKYVGLPDMWLAGENEFSVNSFLNGLIFFAKKVMFDLFKNKKDFISIEKIKEYVIENSNNIMCLSILNNFGLRFEKEIPGFCIDFVSCIDLVLIDIKRGVFKTQMFNSAYKDNFCNLDLREYAINFQINNNENKENKKIFKIFDYLYSITKNTQENAIKFLQIQQMDLRNASKEERDSFVEILPCITGEAKKLVEKNESSKLKYLSLDKKISDLNSSINKKQVNLKDIDSCITEILSINDELFFCIYKKRVILLIDNLFSNFVLSVEKKDEYLMTILTIINGDDNIFAYDECIKILPNLLESLNDNIDYKIKIDIKNLMLKCLLANNINATFNYKVTKVIKDFLKHNNKLGATFLTTILLLAKDEMSHQIFNNQYLLNKNKTKDNKFKPNRQPHLRGVDYYIEKDGDEPYSFNTKDIIEKYLYNEEEYNFGNFRIEDFDIQILSNVFNCGFNINNLLISEISSQYIDLFIELSTSKEKYNLSDIVGIYESSIVAQFFHENLIDSKTTDKVLSILFSNRDYSSFTNNIIDYYLQILNCLTARYFDSYNEKEQRTNIEIIVKKYEEKINLIEIEYVKQKLYNALILGFYKYNDVSDWINLKTDYSYKDKMFLCDIFSKYGYFNFNESIFVIYKLQYKKLAPEIILAINSMLTKYFEKYEIIINKSFDDYVNNKIDEIMFYIFSHFETNIKDDKSLIDAFENILSILVSKCNDKYAAILLDEFRIH